jgi:peptide/nickel transport system permease protein
MSKNKDKINQENEKIVTPNEEPAEEVSIDKIVTPGQLVLKRFKRNKLAILGLFILLLMFLFAFVGPLLTGYHQTKVFMDADDKLILRFARPSAEHLLGTDGHGMDIMSRLMYGGRVSLTIGFVVIGIELFIGVILGGMAGFYGGWIDNMIMRIVDTVNCIPYLPVMLIVGSIVDKTGVDPALSIYILMLMLGLIGWTGIARMVRGQILSLREQEFMIATEATGLKVRRRIFKHLIPNVIPQLIVIATMGLGGIILTEAALSFLGFGVKHPMASWGNMINSVNEPYILKQYWFTWIPSGVLIFITVLAFNFVGDGLRDAFDPKMKR